MLLRNAIDTVAHPYEFPRRSPAHRSHRHAWSRRGCGCVLYLGTVAAVPKGTATRPDPADHRASASVGLPVCVGLARDSQRTRRRKTSIVDTQRAMATHRECRSHHRELDDLHLRNRDQPRG